MKKRIVYISGIGADRRAFSKLDSHLGGEAVFADWIPLESNEEHFTGYCERLISKYGINSYDILIGLSFGGLIAQQIAKKLGNKTVFLISSFRNKSDLRPLMYFGLKTGLYKLLPPIRIPIISEMIAFVLNSKNRESKKVITQMMLDTDFHFMNWCIRQIAVIDLKPEYSENFINLNGDNDKLVKEWIGHSGLTVSGGSHFMVNDKAKEIASKISSMLNP